MIKILKFEADWCAPCQALKPFWEETKNKRKDLVFKSINVDEYDSIASVYGVRSIPSIVIIKNNEVVDGFIGEECRKGLKKIEVM